MLNNHDAIIVPGAGGPRDGLNPINSLPEWVAKKLDNLANIWITEKSTLPIILLSAGTFHKPGSLDINGRNIQESTGMALYLQNKGVDCSKLYEENASYDTIGNAYFLRAIHTDVRKWKKLIIIVNQFHYPRLKIIFNWIFSLKDSHGQCDYELEYIIFPDELIEDKEVIEYRKKKEELSLQQIQDKITNLKFTTLSELHDWLHHHHDLYSVGNKENLILKKNQSQMDSICMKSY